MQIYIISLIVKGNIFFLFSGHIVKILPLKPPHPNSLEVKGHQLTPHKGFDPSLCYGDVMLSLVYQPQDK